MVASMPLTKDLHQHDMLDARWTLPRIDLLLDRIWGHMATECGLQGRGIQVYGQGYSTGIQWYSGVFGPLFTI